MFSLTRPAPLALFALVLIVPAGLLLARSSGESTKAPNFPAVSTADAASDAPAVVTKAEIAVALLRAGLSPEALAAAGANAQSVSGVLDAATSYLNSHATALPTADTSYASARVNRDALLRTVQSGLASAQQVSSLAEAEQTLATATSQRAAVVQALFDATTTGLAAGKIQALAAMRANTLGIEMGLSPEYLVATLSQADWVKLRDALANAKIAVEYAETPDAGAQAFLATVEATAEVSAAKSNKATLYAAVKTTWDQALN